MRWASDLGVRAAARSSTSLINGTCSQHELTEDLPTLTVKGLRLAKAKYTYENTPVGSPRLTLGGPLSLDQIVARHQVAQLPPNTLWWNAATLLPNELTVIRERIRRRFATAMREVLNEKGYDRHGRSLVDGKESLKGSLEIRIFSKAALLMKYENMKKEATLLLNEVEWQSNRKHGVRRIAHAVRTSHTESRGSDDTRDTPPSVSESPEPSLEAQVGVDTRSSDHDASASPTTHPSKSPTVRSVRGPQAHQSYIPYRDLEPPSRRRS